ncbi:DUF5017 domain-containing protein [Elysia marginata]|uniref:DUF5017 domain-containing protein n=1 Tax=Elysia marginata TaxID=1093978 RepID=A0AAV4FX43_9GAST|nr:DUF5017 domain-containing protein [Elysia marginata]
MLVVGSLLYLTAFISCLKSSFEIPNKLCDNPKIEPNSNIAQIKANIPPNGIISSDKIISGYVVSSDENGSFYKEIFIQDNTSSLSIAIDQPNLYNYFEVGRKVTIKLKDLKAEMSYGQLKIKARKGKISKPKYKETIYRMCEFKSEKKLTNNVSIPELDDRYLGKLIALDRVQFTSDAIGKPFYNPKNKPGRATNYLIEDKNGFNLIVRTSSFVNFADKKIPEGNGKIKGILTKYRSDYQLVLRSDDDVLLSSTRRQWRNISIAALRRKKQDTPFMDTREVRGIITLSGYKNVPNHNRVIPERYAILQDKTAGIALYFNNDKHKLEEGDSISLCIGGHNLDTYSGLVRLETIDFDGETSNGNAVLEIISKNNPIPKAKVTNIAEVSSGEYQSQYVSINNVQFVSENRGLSFKGDKSITDCEKTLNVYTRTSSKFSGEIIPDGRGSIFGVMSARGGNVELLLSSSDGAEALSSKRCTEKGTLFFDENFESFKKDSNVSENGWKTLSENSGNKLWEVGEFGENKYVQASAYKSGVHNMVVWLVSPAINLDNTTGEYLTFKTKDSFNNGNPLEVFLSDNFNGTDVISAKWTPVLDAKISQHTTNGYADLFTHSGTVDLNGFSGNIYIGFKYTGSDSGVTTTIQVDEVQVFGKIITP